MKTFMLTVAATMLLLSGIAHASIEEHYAEKSIKVLPGGPFKGQEHIEILVGDKVRFNVKVFQSEFVGQTIISANANINNTTEQKVKAVYSISFHDKDGKLVACNQGRWDLDPKKDVNYGSSLLYADTESIATVTSYKLRTQVLESTKKQFESRGHPKMSAPNFPISPAPFLLPIRTQPRINVPHDFFRQ